MESIDGNIKISKGLSEAEVREKQEKGGYNELPSKEKRGFIKIIKDVCREPMLFLLIASSVIYVFLGSADEATVLLLSIVLVIAITVYQENKTENALEALKNISSPRALVIRDGVQKRITGREVVNDDIIVLSEGDRVPADVILLEGRNMLVDESLLTGESVPVRKKIASTIEGDYRRPGGDNLPFLYSGSLIVQGQGISRVIAIGAGTEMGKIGKALKSINETDTPLQKQTRRLVQNIFVIVVLLCVVVFFIYGLRDGDWLKGILSGLTLAMSILPEEFPIVLTVFLALGAWRISKKKALTRKISAVEILGAATVLCVDKTGTLTENKMAIKRIYASDKIYNIGTGKKAKFPGVFHELIEYGILACKKEPFDPMEKAFIKLGKRVLGGTEHLHEKWTLVEEYPLSKDMMALSHVWKSEDDKNYIISAKGASEAIIHLCHIGPEERKGIILQADAMAKDGLRVLGVAKSRMAVTRLPDSQHDFDFKFVGLVGLEDPIRNNVPQAIKECHDAGIRVVMITGDYPVTAQNIASQIGIKNHTETITGSEIEKMSPQELKKKIGNINVFSRVVPEQKLHIVEAFKLNGEIVAMTGDGVNDAPALKSAHIGVAMGERGTDVARESSDIVLLDDNFATIVRAVKQGRRIYDNLKKAMAYLVSVHVPIAGVTIISVLAGWPAIFFPVHVVFLEILIDPACSVIFEAEKDESDIMKRPPRNPRKPLFGKKILLISFFQGLFSFLAVALVYKMALDSGQSEGEARSLTFVTLVISNIFLIFTNRSWSKNIASSFFTPNKSLIWVVGGITLLLAAILYNPLLRKVFNFGPMHADDVAIALIAGVLSIVWFEILKTVCARKKIELLHD